MRFRTLAVTAGLVAGLSQASDAFIPHKGADRAFVTTGRAPRFHRTPTWVTTRLATHGLDSWRAVWDADTGVPVRLWGDGVAAAGAMANPATAEAVARDFLATHLRLLAPGASITDFVIVANQLGGNDNIRSVAFEQRVGGVRVLGGAVSFTFKNDRLMMVGSTALPHVAVSPPPRTIEAPAIGNAAVDWLATGGITSRVTSFGDRVIVPIVRPHTRTGLDITYRLAETVEVESLGDPGLWNVWVGADDGVAFARASKLMFATGTVQFDVPDQSPSGTRHPKPAPSDNHKVNGVTTLSSAAGLVTWTGTAASTVAPGLVGPLIAITNKSGALVTDSLTLQPNGTVTWSKATDSLADAQLDSFVFASTVKAFAKAKLNPTLAYLNQQLSVNVNETQTCNAFSTGDDIHFFIADTQCENTGRIADVVYHEFGHSLHNNSIIPGVGAFDGSLSEGLADTTAIAITGDHGLGRGFFFNNNPLRDVEPTVKKKWPQDADGEPHDEGEIIGEALWDTRQALETKLGQPAGYAQFLKIYYGIMQRSSDIPTTTFAEALAADDDDGNLANGTPNQCEIINAFGAHGLADPSLTLGIAPPTVDNLTVKLSITPPGASACPPPAISSVMMDWQIRGTTTTGQVPMTQSGNDYTGDLPAQPDGTVIQYRVTVTFADSSQTVFPDNKADPMYERYFGTVTPIKCFDFEGGAADWTHTGTPASADEWEAGMPKGVGGDPAVAHGGANAFGMDLGTAGDGDGQYAASITTSATSPEIDLMGHTNVRLQYYRWLGVEDGAYDHATISANGMQMWTNFASPGQPTGSSEINHIDKEWRFQDVDLSAQAASGKITLKFALDSDQGLQAGGWQMDDVCIVYMSAPGATCGNGVVDTGEECDDGNTADGDGCSATCQAEDGMGGKHGGGCCSTGGSPAGALGLGALVIGLVLRRRRR